MASINAANLILTMQQKITSTTCERDLFYYSKVMQQLRSGKVYVVNNVVDLPTASSNVGELYYVVYNETLYVANALRGWVTLTSLPPLNLWTWGSNNCGLLGNNDTTSTSSPVREISSSTIWWKVSSSKNLNVGAQTALKSDGSLWAWGGNACGGIGDNSITNRSSPVREISSSCLWCNVSAGASQTASVKNDGTLWTWGANECGMLGTGTITDVISPVKEISSSNSWCSVSTNCCHMTGLKSDGTLWAWGSNQNGQLGNNTATPRSSPVGEISASTTWCSAIAGSTHTIALKTAGSLWAWGANACGQLGDTTVTGRSSPVQEITSSSAWCQVSAGCATTISLKTDGTLWAWGYNGCGQLGTNNVTSRSSPLQEISSATTWCQASSGMLMAGGLKTDGSAWAWGQNNCGQLGDNTVTSKSSPIREITSATTWFQISAGQKTMMILKK